MQLKIITILLIIVLSWQGYSQNCQLNNVPNPNFENHSADKKRKSNAKYQRAWGKKNADKKRKSNKEWNAKNMNEYQRAYRAKLLSVGIMTKKRLKYEN